MLCVAMTEEGAGRCSRKRQSLLSLGVFVLVGSELVKLALEDSW